MLIAVEALFIGNQAVHCPSRVRQAEQLSVKSIIRQQM